MDKKLHLLESFTARGSDGRTYRVFGYEHMVRDQSLADAVERWESTGTVEYRLADGRRVDLRNDGSIRITDTGTQSLAA